VGPVVVHVDADAFFASVEQRQKPSLASSPVIVGGLGGRGVVATASYEARRFGIGSAMPMATARRRCPQGVFLHPRMDAYRAHSVAIMGVLHRFSDVLEQVSVDEAYLQVEGSDPLLHGRDLDGLVSAVAAAVLHETGLRVSVGAGASKLVAKLASTAAKPRGMLVITREAEQAFLDALPVTALPGVGPVAAARLTELGIDTVAAVRVQPVRTLERLLGPAGGAGVLEMAHGRDARVVTPWRGAKSVSAERTLEFDTPASQLGPVLDRVLVAAHARLLQAGVGARTVTVRLKDADFAVAGRAVTVAQATSDLGVLRGAAVRALAAVVAATGLDAEEESGAGARLLGVHLGGLSPQEQLSLLPAPTPSPVRTVLPDPAEADDTERTPTTGAAPTWWAGTDVVHDELGRGWVVRELDALRAPSGAPEVVVRFEVTGDRSARQRRLPATDPGLHAAEPEPVRTLR
jgi:DNA polymerase-4